MSCQGAPCPKVPVCSVRSAGVNSVARSHMSIRFPHASLVPLYPMSSCPSERTKARVAFPCYWDQPASETQTPSRQNPVKTVPHHAVSSMPSGSLMPDRCSVNVNPWKVSVPLQCLGEWGVGQTGSLSPWARANIWVAGFGKPGLWRASSVGPPPMQTRCSC